MKLQLKKKQLKSLQAKDLNNKATRRIAAAGATFGSRIDCGSWQICDTHPAICESMGLCRSADIC
ncbi:hypothetical protein [Pseudoalteromonas piscicida]|uniref:hypothetical protein n=1 Tax=Pseudoalteromonas piscicida TaxID=43662 RepID=UPI0030B3BCD4